MGGLEKLLEYLDHNPRFVALSLFVVIVAGGGAGLQYINTLNARIATAEEQKKVDLSRYQHEVESLQRARIGLAAALTTFKDGTRALFAAVDAQSKAGLPKTCATHVSKVQAGCDGLRQALHEAEVLAPVFEDLERVIKISKLLDQPGQDLAEALSLRSGGDTAQALALLRRSLKARESPAAYSELAALYSRQGRTEDAKAALAQAERLALSGGTGF